MGKVTPAKTSFVAATTFVTHRLCRDGQKLDEAMHRRRVQPHANACTVAKGINAQMTFLG